MINPKSNLVFWVYATLVIAVIELSFILLLVPTQRVTEAINREKTLCADQLGIPACSQIKSVADRWYHSVAHETGAREATFKFFIGNFEQTNQAINDFDDRGVGMFSERFFRNLWGTLYIATWRLASALTWAPWFAFLAVAVVVDAVVLRKIEMWRFSHRSPLVHWIGLFTIFLVFELALLILILPWALSPLWPPFAYAIVLGSLWLIIRNMLKRI